MRVYAVVDYLQAGRLMSFPVHNQYELTAMVSWLKALSSVTYIAVWESL